MTARWVLGFVAIGTLIGACAQVPDVKRRPATCDPAVSKCGKTTGPHEESDDGTLKTTTGAPLEAPDAPAKNAGSDDDSASSADVPLPTPRPDIPDDPPVDVDPPADPADDPLADVGPMCTTLWACCANLRAAGITGSADQCDDTAMQNDELTCDVANEAYKTPDDFYDPVCF
jgi:hypothetical protein